MQRNVVVSIRLTAHEAARLDVLAQAIGTTRGDAIRQALTSYTDGSRDTQVARDCLPTVVSQLGTALDELRRASDIWAYAIYQSVTRSTHEDLASERRVVLDSIGRVQRIALSIVGKEPSNDRA